MASTVHTFLASAGLLLAGGTTLYHVSHILRGDHTQLHGSLSRYYRVLLPYVVVSGAVTAGFFSIFLVPAELSAAVGSRSLVDVAFLGTTLIWLGAAQRIFAAVDRLADEYFSGGGGRGD
ncbi:MAG: hypothetical protein ABEI97_05585 [Candidatus Nanohaloarchaea archaeon]